MQELWILSFFLHIKPLFHVSPFIISFILIPHLSLFLHSAFSIHSFHHLFIFLVHNVSRFLRFRGEIKQIIHVKSQRPASNELCRFAPSPCPIFIFLFSLYPQIPLSPHPTCSPVEGEKGTFRQMCAETGNFTHTHTHFMFGQFLHDETLKYFQA